VGKTAAQTAGKKTVQSSIKESTEALINQTLYPRTAGAPPVAPAQQSAAKVGREASKPFSEKVRDFAQTRANRAAEIKNAKTPVAEQTKGMSLAERAARLEKKGALLTPTATAEALNIKSPDPITTQQRVQASEVREEQRRQREAESFDQAEGDLRKILKFTVPITALSVALVKLPGLLGKWGESILESQRPLEAFNVAIASSFAQLKHQQFRQAFATGAATSGTTGMLADSIEDFKEEFLPVKVASIRLMNVLGTGIVQAAAAAIQLLYMIPEFRAAILILAKIEQNTKPEDAAKANAFRNTLKEIMDRGPFTKQNPRPGEK
jgi:hypothetical protein